MGKAARALAVGCQPLLVADYAPIISYHIYFFSGAFGDSFWHRSEADWHFSGEADPPHGCGVLRGAKVGNGVAVGEGVAVAAGIGVATCACAPAKKATKPTRTNTLRKAIPDRIRVLAAGCGT